MHFQSAVLRSDIVRPSVRPSVRLSECNVHKAYVRADPNTGDLVQREHPQN